MLFRFGDEIEDAVDGCRLVRRYIRKRIHKSANGQPKLSTAKEANEDEYGNTPAQRAELDWLLYNKPLEYTQLVLSGEIEHYLSLGCEHGRLED